MEVYTTDQDQLFIPKGAVVSVRPLPPSSGQVYRWVAIDSPAFGFAVVHDVAVNETVRAGLLPATPETEAQFGPLYTRAEQLTRQGCRSCGPQMPAFAQFKSGPAQSGPAQQMHPS